MVVVRDGVVRVLCDLVVKSETVRTVRRLGFARVRDREPVTRPTDCFVTVCVSTAVVVGTGVVVVNGGTAVVVIVLVSRVRLVVALAAEGGGRVAGRGQFLPLCSALAPAVGLFLRLSTVVKSVRGETRSRDSILGLDVALVATSSSSSSSSYPSYSSDVVVGIRVVVLGTVVVILCGAGVAITGGGRGLRGSSFLTG